MARGYDPFSAWQTGLQMWWMAAEAQSVIAMRMMGMAGLWSVTPGENSRMVTEKATAFSKAGLAASRAIWAGKSPGQVLDDGLRPVRRATRANARRLGKRGPRRP